MAKKNSVTILHTFAKKYLALLIILPLLCLLVIFFSREFFTNEMITISHVLSQKHMPNKVIINRPEVTLPQVKALSQTIADEQRVNELYMQALKLPQLQTEGKVMHCPVEFFAEYDLIFFKDSQQVSYMRLKPSGCPSLTIDYADRKDALNKQGRTLIKNVQQILELTDGEFYGR
jgi:hypothetical protein